MRPAASKAKLANIRNGFYDLRQGTGPKLALTAKGPLDKSGANIVMGKRKNLNAQVFSFRRLKKGHYRLCSPLRNLAVTAESSSRAGANVVLAPWRGKARQVWRAEKAPGGKIRLVNKASGLVLTPQTGKSNANVRQAVRARAGSAKAKRQTFKLVKTRLNLKDRASYVTLAKMARSGSAIKLGNKAAGYSVDSRKWGELAAAVRACGFSLGFVMVDCNTGMTVSYNADRVFFGASTIKALYTTYLFESEIEAGRLSLARVKGLVQPTIVHSNNGTYRSLRAGYGSSSRFARWLRQADVGYLELWPSYSARTLAKTWMNMLAYSNSKGGHVDYWKLTFDHSDMSAIHGALGSYRTTYSKPGWMTGGQYGCILNDAGVVDDRHGRQYVLSILSSASPYGQKSKVQRVVKALDAIHMDMPESR